MTDVQPIPDGYTAITPYLVAEDASGLIEFLTNAFGAVERMRMPMPDGSLAHAEVEIGGAAVMLGSAMPPEFPPTSAQIHLYVEDVDRRLRPGRERGSDQRGRAGRPDLRRTPRSHPRPRRQPLVDRHARRECAPEQIMERMAALGEH